MPSCIVPGCTSGYASNPEKLHFFVVPKDLEQQKLWKAAIKRTDNFVKNGRTVCEKHFRKSDFSWQRELLGPQGQVVGVSHHKVPRLKKKIVPSIFPWVEFLPEDEDSIDETKETNQAAVRISPPVEHSIEKSANDDISDVISEFITVENPSSLPDECEEVSSPKQSITTDGQKSFCFDDLLQAEIQIPLEWTKLSTGCKGTRFLIYLFIIVIKVEDSYESVALKDVMIKDDMSMTVKILGQRVNLNLLNISSFIDTPKHLENSLNMIHRLTVCRGCIDSSNNSIVSELNCKQLKKDFSGGWRNIACPLLLLNSKVCDYCKKSKNTLQRNLSRKMKSSSKSNNRTMLNSQKEKSID